MGLSRFILSEHLWASQIWMSIDFPRLGKAFSHYFFRRCLSLSLSLLLLLTLLTEILVYFMLSHKPLKLASLLKFCFLFAVLIEWVLLPCLLVDWFFFFLLCLASFWTPLRVFFSYSFISVTSVWYSFYFPFLSGSSHMFIHSSPQFSEHHMTTHYSSLSGKLFISIVLIFTEVLSCSFHLEHILCFFIFSWHSVLFPI